MISITNTLRFIVALAVAPLITSMLVVAPIYPHEWFFMFVRISVFFTYSASLLVGLPIALFLNAKQKCTLKTLALSGFILGCLAFVLFFGNLSFNTHTQPPDTSDGYLIEELLWMIWYGVSAGAGAAAFGFISGITNQSSRRTNQICVS